MSPGSDLPAEIADAAQLLRDLRNKSYLSRPERDAVNRAKLQIAYWACRTENIVASRENLTYVLGPDADDIMGSYDRYLERDRAKAKDLKAKRAKEAKGKKARDGKRFWDNA